MKKKYPYGIVEPSSRVEVANSVLDDFFIVTGLLKIRAYILHGLCLGFIRDGGYIEGDNDLDVGVICNEQEKKMLFDALRQNDFTQGRSYHRNTHFHKNKILLDVHFHKSKGFYSSYGAVKYNGKSYPTPSPVEEYLYAYYPNWKIKESTL